MWMGGGRLALGLGLDYVYIYMGGIGLGFWRREKSKILAVFIENRSDVVPIYTQQREIT